MFTNTQVRQFTIDQIKYWWDKAVGHKANPVNAAWYLGHILHAVQDSYPRGHTVRDASDSDCGAIISFQGYDAQHGNGAHKTGDYTPTASKREATGSLSKRYQCAVDASAAILRAFAACAAGRGGCASATINPTLDNVYTLFPGAGPQLAGGSALEFAKTGIATDPNYQKLEITGRNIAKHVLYNPKSTKVWGGSGTAGTVLCGGAGGKAILSKAPTGFGVYREKDFTDYVNPRV